MTSETRQEPASAASSVAQGPVPGAVMAADGAVSAQEQGSGAPPAAAARWSDLRARLLSALVMVIIGAFAVYYGGVALALLAAVACGAMLWELMAMALPARPTTSMAFGVAGALMLLVVLWLHAMVPQALLGLALLPVLAGASVALGRGRLSWAVVAVYGFAILLTGYGFVALREGLGQGAGIRIILWCLGVVVVSDIGGYFVGRSLGGPKFWPRISPKKTWSGTVAGWVGASVVGAGFWLAGGSAWLMVLSPVLALAGQLGDIAESALKRHTGVKDSSRLIPGHGGVLDRFDALIGVVLVVLALAVCGLMPGVGPAAGL